MHTYSFNLWKILNRGKIMWRWFTKFEKMDRPMDRQDLQRINTSRSEWYERNRRSFKRKARDPLRFFSIPIRGKNEKLILQNIHNTSINIRLPSFIDPNLIHSKIQTTNKRRCQQSSMVFTNELFKTSYTDLVGNNITINDEFLRVSSIDTLNQGIGLSEISLFFELMVFLPS